MKVEIDQSGRVEDLSTGTAVAYANSENGALFVSAGVKRKIIINLRKQSFIPSKDLPAALFAVFIFILIKDSRVSILKIDEEYTGKNSVIGETLQKLFILHRVKSVPEIRFARIGKRSRAHILAWRVHKTKGRYQGVKTISGRNKKSVLSTSLSAFTARGRFESDYGYSISWDYRLSNV